MALTDRYYELSRDDPGRAALWQRAMQQTEDARQLLEAWLRTPPHAATARELVLV